MSKVFAFLKDESGATAIEYGLIAAGISVVIITAVQSSRRVTSMQLRHVREYAVVGEGGSGGGSN